MNDIKMMPFILLVWRQNGVIDSRRAPIGDRRIGVPRGNAPGQIPPAARWRSTVACHSRYLAKLHRTRIRGRSNFGTALVNFFLYFCGLLSHLYNILLSIYVIVGLPYNSKRDRYDDLPPHMKTRETPLESIIISC